MGFNTVAVLYNDHTHRIAEGGEFGASMAAAMQGWLRRDRDRLATWFGSGMIVSQAHADYDQVVIVGQNRGCPIHEANDLGWQALDQMKDCLERHGYKVTKRREIRRPG
ncbi:hypothetical protein [Enterovirga rhinocerotis]|uniref:Uncharacterized protein n=1 Tax=Enterovirga rhinocerotis TaxID=1339210 RepID=A0A4R7BZR9_9HYPH|nr:hypothetical protein [Enterovirga rhinocerotis]TDR90265.1 hypothetical protein EV668_3111 [Enterovirga rhinocerotis]